MSLAEPQIAPAGASSPSAVVCRVENLSHRYDEKVVLGPDGGVSLDVSAGEIVTVLGPNGSGKTTLFRLLCTLLPIQSGRISIGNGDAMIDVAADPLAARGQIGIVFQSPSLDAKLTVIENLQCQAALYGIRGAEFKRRAGEALGAMGLSDRQGDFCGKLSGGLKRRVEIAKTLLHRPRFLLLDEPSTGLDPAARLDLWAAVRRIANGGDADHPAAVLMTTHLIDEADRSDRVVLMDAGQIVASGRPTDLRSSLGDSVITVQPSDAAAVRDELAAMDLEVQEASGDFRVASDDPASLVARLIDRLGDAAQSISVGRPTLEDLFVRRTGRGLEP